MTSQAGQTTTWTREDDENPDAMHGITGKGMDGEAWVDIQAKTFTNWVNLKLKERNLQIESIMTDLKDGVKLCHLVEIVGGISVGRFAKMARMRIQQFDNVNMALDAITKKLEIPLVNIGAGDIVDPNPNAILGLIWSLIQKYAILLSRAELMGWLRCMIGRETKFNKPVTNITTDFNDGKALCALVNACADEEEIDMKSLPNDKVACLTVGIETARDKLGIPELVSAKDMARDDLDELSMLAYLGQFHKLRPDGPAQLPRSAGFTEGLYVEVSRGPESSTERIDKGGNNQGLQITPLMFGDGSAYEIKIMWKGQLLTGAPLSVANTVPQASHQRKSTQRL
eukprot:m.306749 g.306749  ORF g.306749 m.306749 type:complete len:341 (+) comp19275_c0_seq1:221-1243(+)